MRRCVGARFILSLYIRDKSQEGSSTHWVSGTCLGSSLVIQPLPTPPEPTHAEGGRQVCSQKTFAPGPRVDFDSPLIWLCLLSASPPATCKLECLWGRNRICFTSPKCSRTVWKASNWNRSVTVQSPGSWGTAGTSRALCCVLLVSHKLKALCSPREERCVFFFLKLGRAVWREVLP